MADRIDEEELTLVNLGNGAAIEHFDEELQTVLENILDPNTEAAKERTITLTVKFKPTADRNEVSTIVQAKSKLVPQNSAHATIFVGRKAGRPTAVVHDPKQLQMQWDDESKPKKLEDERGEQTA